MKRFAFTKQQATFGSTEEYLPPIGGIPYVNTDFTDVLQTQHINCYAGLLEAMLENDTYVGDNKGIILKGCRQTSPANDFNFFMSFKNSIIYLDGEFYQNNPQLGDITINSTTFYLVAGPTTSTTREILDGSTTTASNLRYFVMTTTISPGEAHIKFSSKGTSRYYRRLLKYFTAQWGDIFITDTLSLLEFDTTTGLGYNNMEGFKLLSNGVSGMPNMRGSFALASDSIGNFGGSDKVYIKSSESPPHTHSSGPPDGQNRKPTPGVVNGLPSGNNVRFVIENTFEHTHFINCGPWIEEETKPMTATDPDTPVWNSQNNPTPRPVNNNTGSIMGKLGPPNAWKEFMVGNQYYDTQYGVNAFTGGVNDYPNSNLAKHTHDTPGAFGDGMVGNDSPQGHENRPPYYVVAYYTKII